MDDDIRHARLVKELEKPFVPDYDAHNIPANDKRTAYALEHIAYRMGRIDQKLDQLVTALTAFAAKR